jgi:DNA polymerase III psi subunit
MNQIEKVKIPLSILSDLYKDVLISEPGQIEPTNKKKLNALVLAFIHNNTSAERDELLSGILTACKLNESNSIVLKSTNPKSENLLSINENYDTKNIILFGIDPVEFGLPIAFPHFQIQTSDGIKYVSSPGLEEMLKDKSLKVKLWNSLKQIFL